jgi:ERCC4-type nuclease
VAYLYYYDNIKFYGIRISPSLYTMTLKLEIDSREHCIIKLLEERHIHHHVISLDVGDIRLSYNDNLIALIERKTLTDLGQSITDGRYRDQKKRILDNYPKPKVLYIVEGNIFSNVVSSSSKFGLPADRIRGAIINTLMRDNIKVVCVNDLEGTIMFLSELCTRVLRDPSKYCNMEENVCVTSMPIHTKSSYMTKETFSANVLSLIPGVSYQTAQLIMGYYTDLKHMILSCTEEDIAAIRLNSGRRVGPKLAHRIVDFLKNT